MMGSGLKYKGIENYNGYEKRRSLYKILPIVFIITVIIVLCLGIKYFYSNFIVEKHMSEDEIKYYINLSDKISEGKSQANWQEVAVVLQTLGYEKIDIEDDEKSISKLTDIFFEQSLSGEFVVLSFDEILKKIKLNKKDEKGAKKELEKIKNNALFNGLYRDNNMISFISSLENAAIDNYKEYGILPSITMAQAILESGWGKSELAKDYNNLFGIKADSRWDGEIATIVTTENYDEVIEGNFRKYDNIDESIEDYGKFLKENSRYEESGFFDGKNYKMQAQALENAGYSTAKNEKGELIYGDKLINVIQKYNLMLWDNKVAKKP
jgi:flagellum-specific peptidoglycan hydrolase FlgJ